MMNPAIVLPGAVEALQALGAAANNGGVPLHTIGLVQLRASQINGWVNPPFVRKPGETDERLFSVAAWREAPYFTEAERAALALAEAVSRLSDRDDPVPDDVWAAAAEHFDEQGLAALLIAVANINAWGCVNVATRQPAGAVPRRGHAGTNPGSRVFNRGNPAVEQS
jgi:alkylhydroperoxidase family enzyme